MPSLLNLAALILAYGAALTASHQSPAYRLAMIAGGIFVCIVAVLTLSPTVRDRWLIRPRLTSVRAALAIAPWLLLDAVIIGRGLWWTQRPTAFRFFAIYALVNWSMGWCLASRTFTWSEPRRRAVLMLAAILAVLAIDGAAFGVTAYGCVVSTLLAAIAAIAVSAAALGSNTACLRVFVASLAVGLAVGGLEMVVRVLQVGHNLEEVDSREYAREFYTLTPPGSAFVNRPNTLDEFGPALIAINSLGIRGPELPEPQADLLLIGDSMIEARQLPLEQTLGAKLRTELKRRGMPVRVVAHGMRGWSPLLEWNWYLKVGRRLHARTVMLFFFWNDLWTAGNEASTFSAVLHADGRPDHFNVPVDSNWIWYKHVRAIRLAADVWRRLNIQEVRRSFATMTTREAIAGALDDESAQRLARRLNKPPLSSDDLQALLTTPGPGLNSDLRALSTTSLWPTLRPWELWTDSQRSAAAATEVELQRFSEDVASDGARLVVVYVPNPLQVGPGECSVGRLFERVDTNVLLPPESGIQTWLRDVTTRHSIDLLDPSAAMRAFDRDRPPNDPAPLYLRADCHWSERGHEFMAAYVADWFQHHSPSLNRASRARW